MGFLGARLVSASPHIGLVAIGGPGWMGGANYVRNLATAIRSADPAARISWLCGQNLSNDWKDVGPLLEVRMPRGLIASLTSRSAPPLKDVVARAEIDYIYPLTYDNEYNLGLRFPVASTLGRTRWAGWIPDYQHRHLPELFTQKEIEWRDARIAQLVSEASRVVLSSQSAAADFRAFHPGHEHKAVVLSFAVPPIEAADDQHLVGDVPGRFLLVCNQFWKHKNHLVLFAALRILRSRGVQPPVLCTGRLERNYKDGDYAEVIHRALSDGGLKDQVRLLGLVPRERQVALLRRAVAVVQPSLFEGWSTVVEDARVLGRPSVLSDLAVHQEQNPPGSRFFAARSAEALADVLAQAWAELPAGPDPESEARARETAAQRLLEVGRQFLGLAMEDSK